MANLWGKYIAYPDLHADDTHAAKRGNPGQKKGLVIYITGVLLYFTSWIILIFSPNNLWSNTLVGFMAPAYTPLLWLAGIGLIGDSFYFNLPYKRFVFILLSIIFLLFHNTHTYIIYCRNH